MKKTFKTGALLVVAVLTIFSGCKKDDEVSPDNDHNNDDFNTEEFASIDNDMNDIDAIIYEADQETSNQRSASTCYTIDRKADTLNPVPGFENHYRKFVIHFTAGDCDSITRSGEVIVYKSGRYMDANYKDSVVFSGFKSNGRSISGYKTLSTNQNLTDSEYYVVDTKTSITSILKDSNQISAETIKQKKFKKATFYANVEITGKGQIIQANGDIIVRETIEPVVLKGGWRWARRIPVQGVVMHKNTNSGKSVSIDYGDGSLDRRAVITKPNGDKKVVFLF